jgi:prepilin signal peptidase PulO-like enzyme (type II secretory pathway)
MLALEFMMLILVFTYGLVFGSFVNVVAYRVPRGESIIRPRSHCPHCEHALSVRELVPVLSWLMLKGRCRVCHHPISLRYPLLELATASLFVATYLSVPGWEGRLAWWVFWLLLMMVVGTDLTSMRVPNALSIPGALVTCTISVICGVQSWQQAVLGALVCFFTMLAISLLSGGKMGMGDVKLYLSIGGMLGPVVGLESLVLASFAGAIFGGTLRAVGLLGRRQYMPFVPYIAVGVILVAFFAHDINTWYLTHILGLKPA